MAPLQFRTGEKINLTRLRVFGCPAQIFVKVKDRENNKLSTRSEQGTFIGMSKLGNGNGFIFRITTSVLIILSQTVKKVLLFRFLEEVSLICPKEMK
jgi:hypothetical protein